MKESQGDGCHIAIVFPRCFGKVSELLTEVCMMTIVNAGCNFGGSCGVSVNFCAERKSGLGHVCSDAIAKNKESGIKAGFNTFHRDFNLFEGGYRSGAVLKSSNCVNEGFACWASVICRAATYGEAPARLWRCGEKSIFFPRKGMLRP